MKISTNVSVSTKEMYKTTNGDYGTNFKTLEKVGDVPTYSEIVQSMQDFKKSE